MKERTIISLLVVTAYFIGMYVGSVTNTNLFSIVIEDSKTLIKSEYKCNIK